MAYGIGVFRHQLLMPASYYPTISRPRALELVTVVYDQEKELTMVDKRDWSRLIDFQVYPRGVRQYREIEIRDLTAKGLVFWSNDSPFEYMAVIPMGDYLTIGPVHGTGKQYLGTQRQPAPVLRDPYLNQYQHQYQNQYQHQYQYQNQYQDQYQSHVQPPMPAIHNSKCQDYTMWSPPCDTQEQAKAQYPCHLRNAVMALEGMN